MYYNVEVWSIARQLWIVIETARADRAKRTYDELHNNGMSPRMRRVM